MFYLKPKQEWSVTRLGYSYQQLSLTRTDLPGYKPKTFLSSLSLLERVCKFMYNINSKCIINSWLFIVKLQNGVYEQKLLSLLLYMRNILKFSDVSKLLCVKDKPLIMFYTSLGSTATSCHQPKFFRVENEFFTSLFFYMQKYGLLFT